MNHEGNTQESTHGDFSRSGAKCRLNDALAMVVTTKRSSLGNRHVPMTGAPPVAGDAPAAAGATPFAAEVALDDEGVEVALALAVSDAMSMRASVMNSAGREEDAHLLIPSQKRARGIPTDLTVGTERERTVTTWRNRPGRRAKLVSHHRSL